MASKSHEIAPNITAADWRGLALDVSNPVGPNWDKAIKILDARIRGRFFEPVDELIGLEKGKKKSKFGFTILAIDCLVIETLQGFRDGIPNHDRQSEKLFKGFLLGWKLFLECVPEGRDASDLAKEVYIDCRCALLHSGSTAETLTVGVSGDAFAFGPERALNINRTKLHRGLTEEFDRYLAELRAPNASDLRKKFKKKMDAIAGVA